MWSPTTSDFASTPLHGSVKRNQRHLPLMLLVE